MQHLVFLFIFTISILSLAKCEKPKEQAISLPSLTDPTLKLELVAEQPTIMTPIGIAIDRSDNIYVLESHTHTPLSDYPGPDFDRIKIGKDVDKNGSIETWNIFADTIEDGMNLTFSPKGALYLTTKNSVLRFRDQDLDGIADSREKILVMDNPENAYDHAAILGITIGPDQRLYISKGNTGGKYWRIRGQDHTILEGYGDGGSVFRCQMDGTELEPVATGFWNPFDIKFTLDGRLMLTDNDPDSRGPNRLIEVVPGGDYGYKSMYGGSGIHPFLSWNGELSGTLPYSAPLGEAPCALIDGGFTSFGDRYNQVLLVQIWEENNIVRIPMIENQSTVTGTPEIWMQGDSSFHPVAFATNSKGELFMTDWVIRQYPNHGYGRIWKITNQSVQNKKHKVPVVQQTLHFDKIPTHLDSLLDILEVGDKFEKTIAREKLATHPETHDLLKILKQSNIPLKKQILLTFFQNEFRLDQKTLRALLQHNDSQLRKIALIYIGTKMRTDMANDLQIVLKSGQIGQEHFEIFLETIKNIQPEFVQSFQQRTFERSADIPRILPVGFILSMLKNSEISEPVKALALPYLDPAKEHTKDLIQLLKKSSNPSLTTALLKSLQTESSPELETILNEIVKNIHHSEVARSQALLHLRHYPTKHFHFALDLLNQKNEVLQFAAIKYLCDCEESDPFRQKISRWMELNARKLHSRNYYIWKTCQPKNPIKLPTREELFSTVNHAGNSEVGRLVFESPSYQCLTCHRIHGWGGIFGPDLSNIGTSKSKKQLIDAILNPSSEIAPAWQGWEVVDRHGIKHYGRQIDIHLHNVELMNASGTFDTYEKPRSYGVAEKSLMTEGLHHGMTSFEFNDLIAYLMDLK